MRASQSDGSRLASTGQPPSVHQHRTYHAPDRRYSYIQRPNDETQPILATKQAMSDIHRIFAWPTPRSCKLRKLSAKLAPMPGPGRMQSWPQCMAKVWVFFEMNEACNKA